MTKIKHKKKKINAVEIIYRVYRVRADTLITGASDLLNLLEMEALKLRPPV